MNIFKLVSILLLLHSPALFGAVQHGADSYSQELGKLGNNGFVCPICEQSMHFLNWYKDHRHTESATNGTTLIDCKKNYLSKGEKMGNLNGLSFLISKSFRPFKEVAEATPAHIERTLVRNAEGRITQEIFKTPFGDGIIFEFSQSHATLASVQEKAAQIREANRSRENISNFFRDIQNDYQNTRSTGRLSEHIIRLLENSSSTEFKAHLKIFIKQNPDADANAFEKLLHEKLIKNMAGWQKAIDNLQKTSREKKGHQKRLDAVQLRIQALSQNTPPEDLEEACQLQEAATCKLIETKKKKALAATLQQLKTAQASPQSPEPHVSLLTQEEKEARKEAFLKRLNKNKQKNLKRLAK